MIVAFVFQHLELQPEFLRIFAIEADDRPMGLVFKGLDLIAESVGDSEILKDIAHGVVDVLHSG